MPTTNAPLWPRLAAAIYDLFPLIALWMLGAGLVLLAFRGRVDLAHAPLAYQAVLRAAPGKIVFRFFARDLHLVMGPGNGKPVRFRVLLDGAPPAANHGTDTDADGWGTVREQRLYQLIRQSGDVREHVFSIEFPQAGVQAYSFTFG